MFTSRSIQSTLTFRDKIFSIDYILVFSILTLGVISMFAMYSTDGGSLRVSYEKPHTQVFCLFFFIHNNFFFSY